MRAFLVSLRDALSDPVHAVTSAQLIPSSRETELSELAAIANREHELAERAAVQTVGHAIAAGRALMAAQSRVGDGWGAWLAENFHGSRQLAALYVRLATYQHLIPAERTMGSALAALKGLPGTGKRTGRRSDGRLAERRRAKRLAQQEEAVGRIKGPGSEAYAQCRRLLLIVERAQREATTPDARANYNKAFEHLYPTLDALAAGVVE